MLWIFDLVAVSGMMVMIGGGEGGGEGRDDVGLKVWLLSAVCKLDK